MATDSTLSVHLVNVRGTELSASDTREQYRQKLARITLDSMVQFVGLLDARGTVLEINQVALDAVGIELSGVEGKPFWTTFWWQVSDEIRATLQESILRASRGEFVRWDTEIYGRAGGKETIIIDASLRPVQDEQGKVVFIVAEGRDITEKKAHEREIARQREELAKLDELKTQFFANISHEFRTPLTLMMGPLEDAIADAEGLSIPARERLELAHRNSLRLLKLVNTLLDFSRIEAGRIQASYQPTDLCVLTAELASVFRSAVERAGMRLTVDCLPLAEPVYVDREMWEKIVLNLLSNAFKFTFEGEIEVSLRQVDSAVQLTVRDTGTGIPREEIPRLFERFHRVQGARGRSYEGSGIGLALVQELVKLHGGRVEVESEVDRGTAFTITIPLGRAHLPADRVEAARTMTSTGLRSEAFLEEVLRWLPDEPHAFEELRREPAGGGRRILLADDNADMRGYLLRLLAEYEVEAVEDGAAALRAARERTPDLVLTDVMMPGMDGFELLRELRADPCTREVPVILLSARAGEESRIEGLAAGADDYLVKPFSAREVLARVQSHLELAKLRREAREALRVEDRRKDEFLATLAHELRNPLAPIRNGLQLIRLAGSNPAMSATLEQARLMRERQVQQMVRLVDDLLDVSRISRNKLELRREWVELAAVVRSAVETSRPLIEAAAHDLWISLPPEPVLLDADPVRLAQALSNLLNNAAKYSERGGSIELAVERLDGEVVLRVRDKGIGIPADKLPHIFDMFVQVDRSLERSQGGLGIGLTLVKRLIQMHGGTVEAYSDGPGKGSEIVVRLPVLTMPPAVQERAGDGERAGTQVRRRILVVDDNRDSADSLTMMLKLRGHEVATAYEGLQAVELVGTFQPDVALLDLGMPGLNGYDAARRIRQQPESRDVVLVALTGWGQEEDKRRSQEAGFDAHLVKPVDLAALETLLDGL
jgi:PAS domain S-box-containing protein